MPPSALPALQFEDPLYLWLLVLPAGLGLLWLWQFARRRRDAREAQRRTTPVRERFALAGGLSFWLCLLLAVAALVLALARPQALVAVTRSAGADFILLQDGSASMRVSDLSPDRWQRSVAWIRTFTELLGWQDQRVALALFAHRAAPQVRLTRDPKGPVLLSRPSGRRASLPPRGRHELGHQHRGGHLLGRADVRAGRPAPRRAAQRQGVHRAVGRPGLERRGGGRAAARPGPRHPGVRRGGRHHRRRPHPPASRRPLRSTRGPPAFGPRPRLPARDRRGRRRHVLRARRRRRAGHRARDSHRRRTPRPGDAPRGAVHRAVLVPARRRGGSRGLGTLLLKEQTQLWWQLATAAALAVLLLRA